MDGHLRQFESPNDFIAKKTIHISREVETYFIFLTETICYNLIKVIAIKVGADVNSKAPNGLSMDFLIKLITREDSWILCAENIDDKLYNIFRALINTLQLKIYLFKCLADYA